MEQAKAAIHKFTSHGGHHDTTVHEHVNPAVQQEKFTKRELENTTTVVDKEVHQDHYHTTVLPVKDKEILPEQHAHNLAATESREYRHGNHEGIKDRIAQEAAQFKSTRTVGETEHKHTVAPTVGGEHVHHHVHETVQPVVQKEVFQPVVVHTTVPVHETHIKEPTHHGATALPAMTMEEFKTRGGSLNGCDDKVDRFEGQIPATEAVQRTSHGFHHHGGGHDAGNLGNSTHTHGTTGTGIMGSDRHHDNTGSGLTGTTGAAGTAGTTGIGNNSHANQGYNGDSTTTKKPSLLNKLNPLKDADGDGKKGFMD